MYWKKAGLIVGALATVPAALLAGAFAGHFFFMRLVYKGDIQDFWVGTRSATYCVLPSSVSSS